MKKIRISNGLPFILAAILILPNGGCGQNGGTSGQSGLASTSGAVSATKNSFKEVTAHLEPGGNLYVYLSTEQWLEGLSGKMAAWRGVVQALPALPSTNRDQVLKIFDLVTNLVKNSGIEQISGFGMSAIETEKGLYHTKAVLHHYPGNDSGYLWSAFGKKAHPLDGLDLLPDSTVLASFGDVNLAEIWSDIGKEAGNSGIPEVNHWINNAPGLFADATGLKLNDVLDSLEGEYGILLTLDDSHMITLPLPGQATQMPEPAIMLVAKVKNDLIFNAVDAKLKGNSSVISRETNGIRMRTMLVPLPVPISFRPTIARAGDYLFVASTDSLIESAMAVKAGKKPGLKSTDEFKRLARNIPEQGNEFAYVSRKFTQTILDVQSGVVAATAGKNAGPQNAIMKNVMNLYGAQPAEAYRVSAWGEEGWIATGNMSQDPSRALVLAPAAAVAGVAAGVAIPSIVRAREAAQRRAPQ